MILLFLWGAVFLHYFQKKLSVFTDGLCRTLDEMMDSTVRPQINYEAETLLARISHRLERLYHVMQETRHKVEEEKAELQSLVSDISHQTKTPIANLKMLNDTMLTRRITDETRKEFLHATASQLDKLDFLIQGMVKTSRLETGVITLEKKETAIADTLVDAINGVLAPMERKHLHLSVNCPENLTVAHDSRWTSEALFNLLDNAVKYTPEGGDIHVTVQDWEMYLEIAVTDTGRGIPESVQATIFKRFYREEAVHDVDAVYRMLERMEKKTGIHTTPHMLRRYFGNMRRDAGWPLEMISEAYGHKHIDTTIKYLNIVDDQLMEASDQYYAKHSALYDVEKLL